MTKTILHITHLVRLGHLVCLHAVLPSDIHPRNKKYKEHEPIAKKTIRRTVYNRALNADVANNMHVHSN